MWSQKANYYSIIWKRDGRVTQRTQWMIDAVASKCDSRSKKCPGIQIREKDMKTRELKKKSIYHISFSVGCAFVSQPQGCEFESRSSHFSFRLLTREVYAHASEQSRSRECPFTR